MQLPFTFSPASRLWSLPKPVRNCINCSGSLEILKVHGGKACGQRAWMCESFLSAFQILTGLSVGGARGCRWSVVLHLCCVSSVLCPCLCPEGQLIPLQLGQPKIIRQSKCWQEVSTRCFVMITVPLERPRAELWGSAAAARDKNPSLQGVVLLSQSSIRGSQPGGLQGI